MMKTWNTENADKARSIGLILLATAAGAPFLPKLVQATKGNIAFSVGLMVLLMVVIVIYVPLVLPLLLPGVEVNPMDIAGSLIVLMIIPLAVGAQNFNDPNVVVMLIVGALLMLVVLILTGGELGKRVERSD